jgi:hypothetical protein
LIDRLLGVFWKPGFFYSPIQLVTTIVSTIDFPMSLSWQIWLLALESRDTSPF